MYLTPFPRHLPRRFLTACVNLSIAYAHPEDDGMSQSTDTSSLPGYATALEGLKAHGSFSEVKQRLSAQLGFRLRARSWSALLATICQIRQALTHRRDDIKTALKGRSVHAIRSDLSRLMGIELPGSTLDCLRQQVQSLASTFTFCQQSESPAARYEKIKKRNFINSSRLEGLEIEEDLSEQSLEQILAEYREAS